jgi:hypothetical protein
MLLLDWLQKVERDIVVRIRSIDGKRDFFVVDGDRDADVFAHEARAIDGGWMIFGNALLADLLPRETFAPQYADTDHGKGESSRRPQKISCQYTEPARIDRKGFSESEFH